MNIAWIAPCHETYKRICPYFHKIENFDWQIHVYHDVTIEEIKNPKIFYPHISGGLKKLRSHYVILHYFLDDCQKCKSIKIKKIFGQRIFITKKTINLRFEDIIFKYLDNI